MSSIFKRLMKNTSQSEAQKSTSTSSVTNITEDSFTTGEDDLFSGMEFVPPAETAANNPSSTAHQQPVKVEPQLDVIKELGNLDLNPRGAADESNGSDVTPAKSAFQFINKEEVATSSTDTKTTGQTLELGDEQTRDHLTKTTYQDNVQKQTAAAETERLNDETTPIPGSTSWKPVKAQTRVKKKKKGVAKRPGTALRNESSTDPVEVKTTETSEETIPRTPDISVEQTASSVTEGEQNNVLPSPPQTLNDVVEQTKDTVIGKECETLKHETESEISKQQCEVNDQTPTAVDHDCSKTDSVTPKDTASENTDNKADDNSDIIPENDGGESKNTSETVYSDVVDNAVVIGTFGNPQVTDSSVESTLPTPKPTSAHESCVIDDVVNTDEIETIDTDGPASMTESSVDVLNTNDTNNDVNRSTDSTENNKFSMELTENERLALDVESLRMKENNIKNDRTSLDTKRDQVIETWQSTMLDVDTISVKITSLREQQTVCEQEEDYDQAAEVNQQIHELLERKENFKYQHPVLSETFSQLISEYQERYLVLREEETDLLNSYQNLLTKQETRISEYDTSRDKEIEEARLQLKEEKLKLERSLSHLALDKEHITKNKLVLDEEVDKKTKDLTQEKDELVESRNNVQAEIKELELKIIQLREKEANYTSSIEDISHTIATIFTEFQPRMEKLEEEKQRTETEEATLNQQMSDLKQKEEQIEAEKQRIVDEKEKNKCIITELQSRVDQLKQNDVRKEDEDDEERGNLLHVGNLLHFENILVKDDEQLAKLKEDFNTLELKSQSLTESILNEEGRQTLLKRSLNDLETQLSEFQKSKQVAVKERKYKDAKRISEEIKTLTEEGEVKQQQILTLEKNIKSQKEELSANTVLLDKAKNAFEKNLKNHDIRIIQSLQEMNSTINSFLSRNPDSWFKDIFNLQLSTNENIINTLQKKHDLNLDDMSPTSKTNHDVELKKELDELEKRLQEAEEEEDWDRAEQINEEITSIKQALMDS